MRATLAHLTLFATTVLAGIPGLPECSQSCITNYGGCSQVDVKCICSNTPLIATLACCVSKQCDAADQATVIQFANALCQGQGVTDLPQTATCAAGVTYTGTQALSTATGASSSSASESASSSAAFTTTPVGNEASSTTIAGTASTDSASTASAASTASSTSAAPTHSGAAAAHGAENIGLGLALAGLLAAL